MAMDQANETRFDLNHSAGTTPDYLLDATVSELLADSTSHQRALLGLMAVSHCYDLPLAPMLSRLGGEASGAFSSQVMYFASEVHQGEDPLTVVQDLDRVLTASSALALQVARENGSLSDLYRALLQRPPEPDSDVDADKEIDARLSRLIIRAFFVMSVVSFTAVRIFPEFSRMLEEFGLEFPEIMQFTYSVLDWSFRLWFLGALLLILFGFLLAPRYLRRWNPVAWRKKVIPKSALRRQTLAIVAQDSEASKTGITRFASSTPIQRFFPKLAKASTQEGAEKASWESLAAQGVITKREASTLGSTRSGETQAWLLRWSANALGDRKKSRSNWGFNLMIWLGNILLAVIVFVMCITIFSTLLVILESLV